MIEDVYGEVYAMRSMQGHKPEVAIKVSGGKVIRFPTDEQFTLGETVLVRVVRIG